MGGETAGSSARKLPMADRRCYVRNLGPRSHLRYNDRQTAAGQLRTWTPPVRNGRIRPQADIRVSRCDSPVGNAKNPEMLLL